VKCYFDYSESNEDTSFLVDVYNNFKANNGREPDASEMSWMNHTNHTVTPPPPPFRTSSTRPHPATLPLAS
jgi:hypothetical protein